MLYLSKIDLPNYKVWEENFISTEKYTRFRSVCSQWVCQLKLKQPITIRERTLLKEDYDRNLPTIFWYEWILNQVDSDDLVLDIGCGNHIFKSLYPDRNLIGADKENTNSDIKAYLTDLDKYNGKAKSVFCFNSIHFTDDQGFKLNLEYLSGLLQPNCFGVITINNYHIDRHRANSIDLKKDSVDNIFNIISISDAYELVYFESKIEYTNVSPGLTGDIHMVIRKHGVDKSKEILYTK